jgi:hypothetical protein
LNLILILFKEQTKMPLLNTASDILTDAT